MSNMNRREADALDRYITGNYGEDQFKNETNGPIEFEESNVPQASLLVSRELMTWALGMREELREDFFDPRNQDEWLKSFAHRLLEKVKKDSSVRASND